jgi:hypothetical protein
MNAKEAKDMDSVERGHFAKRLRTGDEKYEGRLEDLGADRLKVALISPVKTFTPGEEVVVTETHNRALVVEVNTALSESKIQLAPGMDLKTVRNVELSSPVYAIPLPEGVSVGAGIVPTLDSWCRAFAVMYVHGACGRYLIVSSIPPHVAQTHAVWSLQRMPLRGDAKKKNNKDAKEKEDA